MRLLYTAKRGKAGMKCSEGDRHHRIQCTSIIAQLAQLIGCNRTLFLGVPHFQSRIFGPFRLLRQARRSFQTYWTVLPNFSIQLYFLWDTCINHLWSHPLNFFSATSLQPFYGSLLCFKVLYHIFKFYLEKRWISFSTRYDISRPHFQCC